MKRRAQMDSATIIQLLTQGGIGGAAIYLVSKVNDRLDTMISTLGEVKGLLESQKAANQGA